MNLLKGHWPINTSSCASLHPSPLDYYHSQLWHVLTHRLMTTCQVCHLRHLLLQFPLTTLKHTHTEQENTQMHENTITNMCCFYIQRKSNMPFICGLKGYPLKLSHWRNTAPPQGFSLFPSKGVSTVLQKKGVTSADRRFPICIVFAAACTLSRGHLYIW